MADTWILWTRNYNLGRSEFTHHTTLDEAHQCAYWSEQGDDSEPIVIEAPSGELINPRTGIEAIRKRELAKRLTEPHRPVTREVLVRRPAWDHPYEDDAEWVTHAYAYDQTGAEHLAATAREVLGAERVRIETL